nr:PREDICTED: diphthine methyltransferase homolog [Bemisia tabaci]
MEALKLETSMDTILFADSVEWCPILQFQNILVCGTYQQRDQGDTAEADGGASCRERVGCIYVLEIKTNLTVKVDQSLITAGILDMKWCDRLLNGHPALGVATAAGELDIYQLIPGKTCELKLFARAKLEKESEKEILGLSLDWNKDPSVYQIVISDSHGGLTVFTLDSNGLSQDNHWNAHGHEAWITCFDRCDSSRIYSGGDDCLFKIFDVRCTDYKAQLTCKTHGAGVTSLHCNPISNQYLASGSYDELLRVWDVRKMKHPINSINLGGGIWRIKWDPERGVNLATACMYNNFHLVADHGDKLEVVTSFRENSSIAYGIDFCYYGKEEMKRKFNFDTNFRYYLLAMCSFYDHKMFIASVNVDKIGSPES